MDIKREDLLVRAWTGKPKSSHNPKIPNGVAIYHKPTGIEVKEDGHRLQHVNWARAIDRLQELIKDDSSTT